MDNLRAIILAGGKGTRLASVVSNCPKPLAGIAGKPFIEWVLRYFQQYGVNHFTISLGHMSDVAKAYFTARPQDSLDIKLAIEEKPLGTGGAFYFASQESTEEILLLSNGDSLLLTDLNLALTQFVSKNADGIILGRSLEDASRYGTLEYDSAGKLYGFVEKRPGEGVVNGGIYIFRKRVLAALPHHTPMSMETEGIPKLLQDGFNIYVSKSDAPFIDIGIPETYYQAESFIKNHFKES